MSTPAIIAFGFKNYEVVDNKTRKAQRHVSTVDPDQLPKAMGLSSHFARTAVAQPLVCSKNKTYSFAIRQNKNGFMELKANSTKWAHSDSPTSRLKYTFLARK